MITSTEFIKGYTKIIICAYLFNNDDYLFNIVKKINEDGKGLISLSNPSALISINELEKEKYVSFDIKLTQDNQKRKFYKLTESGKDFYLKNKDSYLESLSLLSKMISDDEK